MADELVYRDPTPVPSLNLYGRVLQGINVWNGVTLQVEAASNWPSCGISMVDFTGTALYRGNAPSGLPSGVYALEVRQRSGAVPSSGDTVRGYQDPWQWNGNREITSTPEDIWNYGQRTLTQTASQIASALQGDKLTIQRGDTLSISITGLGSLVGRTKLWFTCKQSRAQADSASTIQLTESGGLIYVNGAAYATSAHGSITVTDAISGNVTIVLHKTVTALLNQMTGVYDMQWMNASSQITTLTEGSFSVIRDVTRATS